MTSHKPKHRRSSPLFAYVSANTRHRPFRVFARAVRAFYAVIFTATILVPAIIMSSGTAYALDPGWPTWLSNPPSIPGGIGTKLAPIGALTGTAAEVAVPAAEVAGTGAAGVTAAGVVFAGGVGVLTTVGTVQVLKWVFGDNGDDRGKVQMELTPGFAMPGWTWNSGTCCNSPAWPASSVLIGGDYDGRNSTLINQSGVERSVTFRAECVATATGVMSSSIDGGPTVMPDASGWNLPHFSCPSDGAHAISKVRLYDTNTDEVIYQFSYDPPRPWTVNVVQYCRNPTTGAPATATSTPYSFTPVAGEYPPEITVPDCPSGTEPEAVAMFGGRTGTSEDLSNFLVAIPTTRTQTAAGTPPTVNTSLASCNGPSRPTTGKTVPSGVTISSTTGATVPTNLFDGVTANGTYVNIGFGTQNLIYDLGATKYLSHVVQHGYVDGRSYNNWHWDISVNGSVWTSACVAANYLSTDSGMTSNLDNKQARYLRFSGTGSPYNSTELTETEIWLNPAPEPSPAPSPTGSSAPVPGTLGTISTVNNPDGSVTQTQTQLLPDGSKRVVTTTTFPDGSKQVTTQPLDESDNPVGDPTTVNIPAPGSGTEPESGPDSSTNGCMGSWTWNPIAWVYRPVKCALIWAFVPDAATMTEWTTQVDTIKGSGVFSLFETFGNFIGSVATAGSSAYDCPTETAGSYTNGHTTVTKVSPIHWCDIIHKAGDDMQSSSWGSKIYNGAKLVLCVYFAFLWYNRISATAGSQLTA